MLSTTKDNAEREITDYAGQIGLSKEVHPVTVEVSTLRDPNANRRNFLLTVLFYKLI